MKKNQIGEYDAIVVLGAHVKPEGVPSEALRRRLTLALEHYRNRPAPIVCCGARGSDEPEAEGDFMCRWLAEKGVPQADLLSENRSFDTLENIRFARKLLTERGLRRPLVVTSDYHLRRALAICRRYGLTATGAGSPSVRAYWLKNHLRECLAWGKYYLSYFLPERP